MNQVIPISQLPMPVGIIAHPTWDVTDSSKFKEYMGCPRKFFYRYVLGWDSIYPKHALIFGEAWHRAMEFMLNNGYSMDAIHAAFEIAMAYYRQYFGEHTDMDRAPKMPANLLLGLTEYALKYKTDFLQWETLYTEVAGSVPLCDGVEIYFKMDGILRCLKSGKIRIREHKTCSTLQRSWSEQWTINTQPGTYLHSAASVFGFDNVDCVEINGACFQKTTGVTFMRIPHRRSIPLLAAWHSDMVYYARKLREDFELLSESSEDDNTMRAFARNTERCMDWGGCIYHDFCCSVANPLRRCAAVPHDFKQEFWDPRVEGTKDINTITI